MVIGKIHIYSQSLMSVKKYVFSNIETEIRCISKTQSQPQPLIISLLQFTMILNFFF